MLIKLYYAKKYFNLCKKDYFESFLGSCIYSFLLKVLEIKTWFNI